MSSGTCDVENAPPAAGATAENVAAPPTAGETAGATAGATEAKSTVGGVARSLGWREGYCLIVSIIIGSGIFTSPGSVVNAMNGALPSLLMWVVGGVLAIVGSLCYAELGCMMPDAQVSQCYIYPHLPLVHKPIMPKKMLLTMRHLKP